MLKFSANLWYLFYEWEMMDRFGVSAKAGFKAVEFHFPYQWSANSLAQKLSENGLEQVLINAPAGNWEAGERGIAGLSGRHNEFQDTIGLALEYALALDCPNIHIMAGLKGDKDIFAANITYAANLCASNNIKVLTEALNPIDFPDYLISNTQEALKVVDIVNHKSFLLLYDIYHGIQNNDDILQTIKDNLNFIGHMQAASAPGRHEPDHKASYNFSMLFKSLEKLDYTGWIGCEYIPRDKTINGLGWAKNFGIN